MASDYLFHWYLTPYLDRFLPSLVGEFTPCDVQPEVVTGDMDISGKIDFLGLNYYTRAVCRSTNDGWFEEVERNDYPKTEMGWEITPHAFTDLLIGLHQRHSPPIYITGKWCCNGRSA